MLSICEPGYYLARKVSLLKRHDKLIALGMARLRSRHREAESTAIIREARAAFERLIPAIPYIGAAPTRSPTP